MQASVEVRLLAVRDQRIVSTSFLVDTVADKSVELVEGLVVRAPASGRRTEGPRR